MKKVPVAQFPIPISHVLSSPGVGGGAFVAFLSGQEVEVEGGEIFQDRIDELNVSCVNRLNVLMAFVAGVNPIGFLTLCIEIVRGVLFFITAEGAEKPVDSPLVSAKRTEEKSFSLCFLKEAQLGQGTADRTDALEPGFGVEFIEKLFHPRFNRRHDAFLNEEEQHLFIQSGLLSNLLYLSFLKATGERLV
jgi:hypothetical protein